MNRRNFLRNIAGLGIFSILPGAGRVWKAESPTMWQYTSWHSIEGQPPYFIKTFKGIRFRDFFSEIPKELMPYQDLKIRTILSVDDPPMFHVELPT